MHALNAITFTYLSNEIMQSRSSDRYGRLPAIYFVRQSYSPRNVSQTPPFGNLTELHIHIFFQRKMILFPNNYYTCAAFELGSASLTYETDPSS